jgi:uncharacterized protein HemX
MYDFGFNIWGVVSTLINVILGGGFIVTLITLKQQKKRSQGEADQAAAQADSIELNNVEKAIEIWREIATDLKLKLKEAEEKSDRMADEIAQLRTEVKRLSVSNRKMIEMLNKITPENLERMIEKIKDEFNN